MIRAWVEPLINGGVLSQKIFETKSEEAMRETNHY